MNIPIFRNKTDIYPSISNEKKKMKNEKHAYNKIK